jgi:ubiquitin
MDVETTTYMQIFIKTLTGKTITLDVNHTTSVVSVKNMINQKEGIQPDQQRLLFGHNMLDDAFPISYYNIIADSTVYLIIRYQ